MFMPGFQPSEQASKEYETACNDTKFQEKILKLNDKMQEVGAYVMRAIGEEAMEQLTELMLQGNWAEHKKLQRKLVEDVGWGKITQDIEDEIKQVFREYCPTLVAELEEVENGTRA